MADLSGLVRDPEFINLPLSQQRLALVHATGDGDFSSLSDQETQTFLSRARNATPTQFEKDRTPTSGGFWNAVKQDIPHAVGDISETTGDQRSPLSVKAAATGDNAQKQYEAEQQARKAAGYGTLYRTVAPVGQYGLGVNAPGMEEAAAHGDSGAVVGHGAIPAATAVAPLAAEAVMRGIPAAASAARPAVGATLRAVGDVVDPEITGIVSPRAAHLQRIAGRVGNAMRTAPTPETGPIPDEAAFPVTTPSDVPLEHIPSDLPPEASPVAAHAPTQPVKTIKDFRSWADNFDDAQIRQAMSDDLYKHAKSAYGEERATKLQELRDMGVGQGKWERVANQKAQAIMDEATQKAQQVLEQSRQKSTRSLMSSVPRNPAQEEAMQAVADHAPTISTADRLSAIDNLEELLRKSIERARAAKGQK